jgi:L-rhamnose mutarotase
MSALDTILLKHNPLCRWEELLENDRKENACVCLTIQARKELAELRLENDKRREELIVMVDRLIQEENKVTELKEEVASENRWAKEYMNKMLESRAENERLRKEIERIFHLGDIEYQRGYNDALKEYGKADE